MKLEVELQLREYDSVLSGYTVLLIFRLMNLCVKPEPASLLPVVVEFNGREKKIEETAQVGIKEDENALDVYPLHEDLIVPIGKAIMDVHPEFRQELKTVKIEGQEKELKFIRLYMPDVNDDRKKALEDGVKTFRDAASAQMDAAKAKYTALVEKALYKCPKEDVEEAHNRLDEITDDYTKRVDKAEEDKQKEIAEAYQLWQEKQDEKQKEQEEKQAAKGDDVKSKMKMPAENE
jgi:ribosome recycling factor